MDRQQNKRRTDWKIDNKKEKKDKEETDKIRININAVEKKERDRMIDGQREVETDV